MLQGKFMSCKVLRSRVNTVYSSKGKNSEENSSGLSQVSVRAIKS